MVSIKCIVILLVATGFCWEKIWCQFWSSGSFWHQNWSIPPSLLITAYRPDIVIYNQINNSVALLELTCPLDSVHHLEPARERKQGKTEYQQILSEFDRLGIPCSYHTIELSVLGHYLPSSLSSFQNCVNFIQNQITMTC